MRKVFQEFNNKLNTNKSFKDEFITKKGINTEFISYKKGDNLEKIISKKNEFLNLRCRNMTPQLTKEILEHFDDKYTRYFVFIRHPASFIRSATTYHLRGDEDWCRNTNLKELNGSTLYTSLKTCEDFDSQLIVSMKFFKKRIYRMVKNIEILREKDKKFYVIKVENLWKNDVIENLKLFQTAISHNGFELPLNIFINNTPNKKLTRHSTNEFKKDYYSGFGEKAMEHYEQNMKKFESKLGYIY